MRCLIQNRKSQIVNPKSEIVLLAVTGMSPAVPTETIWALSNENPPVVPDRIVVMTTTVGSDQTQKTLFQPHSAFGGQRPLDALRDWLEQRGHKVSGRLRYEECIIWRWRRCCAAGRPFKCFLDEG